MASISVTPQKALVDVPVSICITGLKSNQFITIRSSLLDESGNLYDCHADYNADEKGIIDLNTQPSTGGSYTGVEPMGLFWALEPSSQNKNKHCHLLKKDVSVPFEVNISVFDCAISNDQCNIVASVIVERWYKDEGISRIVVREGRVRGSLFVPSGPGPFPGVLDIYGAVGGLVEHRGALLASKGFFTFCLAYFAYDDLPKLLISFDLEYFEEAKEILRKHPKVNGRKIAIVSSSSGGMFALAMASCLNDIACVVNINGPVFLEYCQLNYKGQIWDGIFRDMCRVSVENNVLNPVDCLVIPSKIEDLGNARLHIDKSDAAFFLVCSGDDGSMRQNLNADLAVKIFKESNKTNYKIAWYPGAGHMIEPPYTPLTAVSYMKEFGLHVQWGGKPKDHARAQENSWREIVEFLRKHLT